MKEYNRASALLAGAALSARQGQFELACDMILKAAEHASFDSFVDEVRASALSARQIGAGAELRMDGPDRNDGLREVQEGASETAAGSELREVVDDAGEGRTVQTGAGAELREDVSKPGAARTVQTGAGSELREVVDDAGQGRTVQTGAGSELREVVDDAGQGRTVQQGSVPEVDNALEYMGLLAKEHCKNYAVGIAEFHRNDPYKLVSSVSEAPVKVVSEAAPKVEPVVVRETATVRFTKALRNAAAHRRTEEPASKS